MGKSVKFQSQNCFVSTALVQWRYIMDQQSAHTLTDNVYIQRKLHTPPLYPKVFTDCPCGFSAHPSLASNLAASVHGVIFSKLSINSPLKPDNHRQSSLCRWEPDEVWRRFRLTSGWFWCPSALIKNQTPNICCDFVQSPNWCRFQLIVFEVLRVKIEPHEECFCCVFLHFLEVTNSIFQYTISLT